MKVINQILTAIRANGRQHLQERLSTAWELAEKPAPAEWRELIVADAARLVSKLDPRQFLPFHLPRASRWTLLVLALAAGLGFIPEYRNKAFLQNQR